MLQWSVVCTNEFHRALEHTLLERATNFFSPASSLRIFNAGRCQSSMAVTVMIFADGDGAVWLPIGSFALCVSRLHPLGHSTLETARLKLN